MISGKFLAQDDFDLAGHRFLNWQWIQDIPTKGAVDGQAIVSIGGIAQWATLSSSGVVSTAWDDITDKPATFPADPHTHPWDEVTGKPTFVNSVTSGTGINVSATTGLNVLIKVEDLPLSALDQSGATLGQGILWSGTTWLPGGVALATHTHSLSDITQSGAAAGEVPVWNSTATEWEADNFPVYIFTGSVYTVDPNYPADDAAKRMYTTIQAAITAASSGDAISINPGDYTENLSIVNKSLSLFAAGKGGVKIIGSPAVTFSKTNNTATHWTKFFDIAINANSTSNPVIDISNTGGSRQARLDLNNCSVYSQGSGSAISIDGSYISRFRADDTLFAGEGADMVHIESTSHANSYILLFRCDHDGCIYRLSKGRLAMYNTNYITSVIYEASNTNSQNHEWLDSTISGPVVLGSTTMGIVASKCTFNSSTYGINCTAANNKVKLRYCTFNTSGSYANITAASAITADISGCLFNKGMVGNVRISKPVFEVGPGTDSYYTVQDALDATTADNQKIVLNENQTLTSFLSPPSYSIMIDGNHQFSITRSAGTALMALGASDDVKFVNIDLVGSLDVSGAGAKLKLADHTYLNGMIDVISGGDSSTEITIDQAKIVGDTSDNYCINIADADPTIKIKRSYLKANGANPAIYWSSVTNSKVKIAYAAIIHGSGGANNPFGRSGSQTPNYASHHAAYTHDPQTGGVWTNLIGTPYDAIDVDADY